MNTTILHKYLALLLLLFLLSFSGCGTTDTSKNDLPPNNNSNIRNILPVADAGDTITVAQNEFFTFDASGSYDSDGNITTYEWYCTDFNISLYKGSKSTLTIPAQRPIGVYNTKLTVTDDKNATAVDYVLVKIVAPVFVADAGENFQVVQNEYYTLDANNSFYLNGNIISYEWIYKDNNITLYKGPNKKSPSLQANRSVGNYEIKLIVTNDKNQTAEDSVTIHIEETSNNQFKDIYSIDITVTQFKVLKEHNIVYIDVRHPSEWASSTGIIENSYKITKPSDINTWLQNGSDFLNIVTDKEQSFILICAAGSRATTTANQLKDKGYNKVHYLIGGINGWIDAGEPTVPAN
jgi:rhodanese-related sulfurtransferase